MQPSMKIRIPALVFAAALLGAAPAAPDLARLKSAALGGGAQAELDYAKALEQAGDRDGGRAWAQKAAAQDLGEAWYWLGTTALPADDPAHYYVRAAELGYKPAFGDALDALLFRAGAKADVARAKRIADLGRRLHVEFGYDTEDEYATVDACYAAGSPELPAADLRAPPPRGSDCDEYHGQWQQYRACLIAQSSPNTLLAEVYANGWGVARDTRLATALVCHGSEVPAELMAMVATLQKKTLDRPFLFCEHVTSGMNGAECAAQAGAIADKKRAREIATIARGWKAPETAAFRDLRGAADAFFEAHAGSEQDNSGSGHLAFYIEEVGQKKDAFVSQLKAFEAGKRPPHDDFAARDRAMNAAYRHIIKDTDWNASGTLSAEGIRETQRKWLVYRDAWAKFGVLRYPGTSASDWNAWTTKRRTEELKGIF